MLMWGASALALAATPELQRWVGDTSSLGQSPVQLRLSIEADQASITLWWHAYETTTIEQAMPLTHCDHASLSPVRSRVDSACRGISAKVPSRHPVYEDYLVQDHLRCVLGSTTGWCRLPFTHWFAVSTTEPASPTDPPG